MSFERFCQPACFFAARFTLRQPKTPVRNTTNLRTFCFEDYHCVQGGKTFCAIFCASLIAGSRRAFLCVDCVRVFVCLSLREFLLRMNEIHKVWTFASRKAFLLWCGFCFSSLENYFGLGTTGVKRKTDHPVSLRWNKKFWTFPKRRVFFWLSIRFICEFIPPSFPGWIKTRLFFY